MNNRTRLLSPYPGAKNPAVYPVHDGGDYDCWVAPFAGSGEQEAWIARMYPGMAVIAADADPLVRSVWRCWDSAGARNAVVEAIKGYSVKVESDPEKGFELLSLQMQQGLLSYPSSFINLAAVSIVLRRLTFGGVIRLNSKGELNVGLSQDKLRTFRKGWEFAWPQSPNRLRMFDDWAKAMDFVAGWGPDPLWNFSSAIAIIDPPYCDGTTAAYAHADGTMSMGVDCIDGLLASGNVSRIVAFNYWGEWVEGDSAPTEYPICKAMQHLAQRHNVDVYFSHLGTLATMNKGAGKAAVHRYEGVWEIGGRRLYGSRPIVKPATTTGQQMAFAI